MRPPRKPRPLPSLLPFVMIALLLLVIYGGLLLFPTIKDFIKQDSVSTGRAVSDPRRR